MLGKSDRLPQLSPPENGKTSSSSLSSKQKWLQIFLVAYLAVFALTRISATASPPKQQQTMGGDAFTPLTYTPEEGSSDGRDFGDIDFPDFLGVKVEDVTVGDAFGETHLRDDAPFSVSLALQRDRRRQKSFADVSQAYQHLQLRGYSLQDARSKILSYVPGALIKNAGRVKMDDYNVPETTTLILIGPKGSGKSSLINRISRVIEGDKFGPDRAQVSYTQWAESSSIGEGTCFLQEYMIPRGSTSFCIYDTRSLSENASDNIDTIKCWMTKGVRHRELVTRRSDSSSFKKMKEHSFRSKNSQSGVARNVNFVIFVVNAVAVLKAMEAGGSDGTKYIEMIASTFNSPYVSFRDDKPVVVITHGDLLSMTERILVRVHLGVLLNIPPATQIFDIPDDCNLATEWAVCDMLWHSLEHADRNFPFKDSSIHKQVHRCPLITSRRYLMFVLLIVVASILIRKHTLIHRQRMATKRPGPSLEVVIDWHAIRHLWSGAEEN